MAVDRIPNTNVHDGARIGTGNETIIVPNTGKRMEIVGFRMQIHTVTSAGIVELIGRNGTKVTGGVYVDTNGLNYVQDRIRVPMRPGEVLRLQNGTDGTVQWAVFIEEFESAPRDTE